jgi:arginyl-tRNA synthetase
LRQTNGTTLYATRDLAAMFQRFEEFEFARCLYVVGSEQRLHFRQLKAVLQRMNVPWEPRIEHVDCTCRRARAERAEGRRGRAAEPGYLLTLRSRSRDSRNGLLGERVNETRRARV